MTQDELVLMMVITWVGGPPVLFCVWFLYEWANSPSGESSYLDDERGLGM